MLWLWLEFILQLLTIVTGIDDTIDLTAEQLIKMMIQQSIELTADMSDDFYQVHAVLAQQESRRFGAKPRNISTLSSTSARRRKRDLSDESIKLKMENLMMRKNYGFFSAAMVGIINTIVEKEDRDLKRLIDVFGKTILRKSNEGELISLANFFESRVKLLVFWTSLLPLQTIQSFANNIKLAIENGNMLSKTIYEIVSVYDTFFTANEGEQLLSTVAELYEYNSYLYEGSAVAVHLVENFVDALLAPANHKEDFAKFAIFISMLNKIYMKTFPDFWRSETDAMVETITRYEKNQTSATNYITKIKVTSREGHVIHIHYNHIKPGFKEILHHLFRKHPKFYEKLLDHVTESKKHVRNGS